jgi:hypothetical protein
MRQGAFLGTLLAVLLVGLVARFGSQAIAQQGTPTATPAGEARDVGISFEPFAITPVESLSAAPARLLLGRDRLEPGEVNVVPPGPELGLIAVATGIGQITIAASIVVTRAGTGGEPGPQETTPGQHTLHRGSRGFVHLAPERRERADHRCGLGHPTAGSGHAGSLARVRETWEDRETGSKQFDNGSGPGRKVLQWLISAWVRHPNHSDPGPRLLEVCLGTKQRPVPA